MAHVRGTYQDGRIVLDSAVNWIAGQRVAITPEEESENARFDERMRQFNLEAVRRQMAEEPQP